VTDPREGLIRQAIADFNRGDLEGVVGEMEPDVEVFTPAELGNAGTFHGRAEALAWMQAWMEAWEHFHLEPTAIEQHGDDFLVDVQASGRGRGSGIEVELHMVWLYTVPERCARRLHLYPTYDEARAAIGQSR
jgi:ketosteroid isomerase-like protein